MSEKHRCEYCSRDAIGYQSFGCCFAYVCRDHADPILLSLAPGERRSSGECHFERFDTPDP